MHATTMITTCFITYFFLFCCGHKGKKSLQEITICKVNKKKEEKRMLHHEFWKKATLSFPFIEKNV